MMSLFSKGAPHSLRNLTELYVIGHDVREEDDLETILFDDVAALIETASDAELEQLNRDLDRLDACDAPSNTPMFSFLDTIYDSAAIDRARHDAHAVDAIKLVAVRRRQERRQNSRSGQFVSHHD